MQKENWCAYFNSTINLRNGVSFSALHMGTSKYIDLSEQELNFSVPFQNKKGTCVDLQ